MNKDTYLVHIFPVTDTDKAPSWCVKLPAIPGVEATEPTLEGALQLLRLARNHYFEEMEKRGQTLPSPDGRVCAQCKMQRPRVQCPEDGPCMECEYTNLDKTTLYD